MRTFAYGAVAAGVLFASIVIFLVGRLSTEPNSSRLSAARRPSEASRAVEPSEASPPEDYVKRRPLAVPQQGLDLVVRLEPLAVGHIVGEIVDNEGNPVPRVKLRLSNLQAQNKSIEVIGNDGGLFEVDNVPAGNLLFQTTTFPRFRTRGIELLPGATELVRLVIDQGPYEVSGKVTDAEGAPFTAARVELVWYGLEEEIRFSSKRKTWTDETGSFKFTRVGRGPHSLKISAPGHNSAQLKYEVGGDADLPPVPLIPRR